MPPMGVQWDLTANMVWSCHGWTSPLVDIYAGPSVGMDQPWSVDIQLCGSWECRW